MGVIKMKVFCLLCIVFSISVASREAGRKPRLFLVSTSSTTLTVSTASICYMKDGNTAFKDCTARKKRRGIQTLEDMEDKILKPTRSELEYNRDSDNDIGRVGRFFLHWITTTSISTTTTYTTTYKVTVKCTFPYA